MNNFIVGVKRIANGQVATPEEDAIVAMATCWLLIDGVEIPGAISSVTCSNVGTGPMEVTVKFVASEYRTVDFQEKEKFLQIKEALNL